MRKIWGRGECGPWDVPLGVLKKLGGLTLMVFLVTFGAPFWNDVLSALAGFKNLELKKGRPGAGGQT